MCVDMGLSDKFIWILQSKLKKKNFWVEIDAQLITLYTMHTVESTMVSI